MDKDIKPLYVKIAERLIATLEEGTSPFQKPWTNDNSTGYVTPLNPTTGKNYRGMNALWLAMQEREDPRWMTLKQASYNKWTVEKGSKATLINFVKTHDLVPATNDKGEKVIGENGKVKMLTVKLDKPIITNAWVFNAEQIKGIPEWKQAYDEKQALQKWSPVERAEQIVAASEAHIKHGGNEAYYNRSRDLIQMPKKEQFDSSPKYYATLLHELGHWSGNETRLNRDLSGRFGSPDYAKEELRAEIASLMIGSELNIGHEFGQHAAYVESWIKVLKDDPSELFKASADAQRITDFVMAFEKKLEVEVKQEQAVVLPDKLVKGDVIPYNDTVYKVLTELKNKTYQVQDSNGTKTKISATDGLYTSLLNAKNNPLEQSVGADLAPAKQEELAEKENSNTYQLQR